MEMSDSNSIKTAGNEKAKSPCINVCQLNSDNICKGCFRTMYEIGEWGRATNDEQLLIVDKALKRSTA